MNSAAAALPPPPISRPLPLPLLWTSWMSRLVSRAIGPEARPLRPEDPWTTWQDIEAGIRSDLLEIVQPPATTFHCATVRPTSANPAPICAETLRICTPTSLVYFIHGCTSLRLLVYPACVAVCVADVTAPIPDRIPALLCLTTFSVPFNPNSVSPRTSRTPSGSFTMRQENTSA